MRKVMADVLKNDGSSYPDKLEAETNYQVGQKLYIEYWYKESMYREASGIAEFEVTGIVLNTLIRPHQTMLEIKTDDAEYKKRFQGTNLELLIFESDMEQYLAKNTELLHEMRGQLAQSLYTAGERYANVELDNGRHIAINEIKDDNGNFANRFKVSLYANSEEIQASVFKNTHHVIRRYEGPDSVDFFYQTLKTALQVNENIKTPDCYRELEEKEPEQKVAESTPSTPVVTFPENQSGVKITNHNGESLELNMMEFWQIVRFGNEMDTRDEIDNFLSDCDLIGNIPVSLITENENAFALLTERVIHNRVYNQSNDEIYDAVIEMKDALSEVIHDDFLEEIDSFIDSSEEYYGIDGSELSNPDALNVMADYILNHTFDSEDYFSDMVYHAIYECQDELKSILSHKKNISFEDKVTFAENCKQQSETTHKDTIEPER